MRPQNCRYLFIYLLVSSVLVIFISWYFFLFSLDICRLNTRFPKDSLHLLSGMYWSFSYYIRERDSDNDPNFHSQPLPLALKLFELWKESNIFGVIFRQSHIYFCKWWSQMLCIIILAHIALGSFLDCMIKVIPLFVIIAHSLVEIKRERLPSVLQTISNLKERQEYVDCWSILILVGRMYVFVWWFIGLAHNR